MRTMSLFAGMGGSILADLILGYDPVCAVEWDAYCCAVLRARAAEGWFPNLHVHEGDIRLFDPSPWKDRVDCLHAGFPCVDISCAGKGAGIAGERSGLISEVWRTIDVIRPRYVFLENSPLIITRGFETILAALAERGYDAVWTILAAADVGAPHLRKRWWCLGWRQDAPDSPCYGRESRRPGDPPEEPERREPDRGGIGGDVRDSNCSGLAKREGERGDDGKKQPATVGADWWKFEPDVCRVATGVPARVHRLRGLGNAQVPLQAAVAWRFLMAVMKVEQRKAGCYGKK